MERVLVSRQPIYDAAMRELGYELLYRNNNEDRATFSDGDQATAEVILNTFEIGLEELVGRHLAFINFDRNLILGNYCESLPRERVVLEIVETIEPDEALLTRLGELRAGGYRIALEHFACSERLYPLLGAADFVRFDVTGNALPAIQRSIASARKYPVKLIAEKVETREQFESCKALGFDYFQGYFFCKPQLVEGKRIPLNKLSTLRLVASLNDPQIKIHEVEEAILRDVTLSYKLLRYANSAMCGLRRPVDSIKHAVVLIGLQKIRIWASLLLLSGFGDKVSDVIATGVIRARMCEQLAKAEGAANSDRLFLVGLFSVLDAIVDQPIGGALASIPLNPAVAEAILYQKGPLGGVLKSVLAYERRDWVQVRSGVKLPAHVIRQAYVDAVGWALSTLNGLSGQTGNKPQKAAENSRLRSNPTLTNLRPG